GYSPGQSHLHLYVDPTQSDPASARESLLGNSRGDRGGSHFFPENSPRLTPRTPGRARGARGAYQDATLKPSHRGGSAPIAALVWPPVVRDTLLPLALRPGAKLLALGRKISRRKRLKRLRITPAHRNRGPDSIG